MRPELPLILVDTVTRNTNPRRTTTRIGEKCRVEYCEEALVVSTRTGIRVDDSALQTIVVRSSGFYCLRSCLLPTKSCV
jgi:hypothetical protein